MFVRSHRIVTDQGIVDGILNLDEGRIVDILPPTARVAITVDAGNHRILPGIIDTHNHGTMGYGLMGEQADPEAAVRGYLKGLASQGVTACLPTADFGLFEAIVKVAQTSVDGAKPIGIHSEGPYLNRVGEKGIDTGHPDIDLKHVQAMIDTAQGMLKLVAIAPEIPGAREAIELLTSQGVRCAFAHSNALYQETLESFQWGITVTTHTANVMAGIHHRRMGGLGACLLNDEVYNELICDGLHVANEMIELMLRVKKNPFDKFMMVSDNVPMAGAPIGRYHLSGMFDVNIYEKGYCLSDTGRLCGSTLPVIRGIRNLAENLRLPLTEIVKMSSRNPAQVYGAPQKGRLAAGMDADFIIIDEDYQVLKTFSEGRCVYDAEKDTDLFNPDFLKACAAE
jgi:N-acetylglucosamine-6-phosphate deacetylase